MIIAGGNMRLFSCLFVFSLGATCFAQDTNFSVGPQYLITTGSPMSMRPIATPSLSLNQVLPAMSNATVAEAQVSQETATSPALTSHVFFSDVYWGNQSLNQIEARRIVTPSATPEETALYMHAVANQIIPPPPVAPVAELSNPGFPATSVIEITSAQLPANLPASIFNPGVTGSSDSQSLRDRGYGVSLGEFATRLRAQKHPAARVFTNEDLHRK
jgi:hypothetical protein